VRLSLADGGPLRFSRPLDGCDWRVHQKQDEKSSATEEGCAAFCVCCGWLSL